MNAEPSESEDQVPLEHCHNSYLMCFGQARACLQTELLSSSQEIRQQVRRQRTTPMIPKRNKQKQRG